jgi:hypothetical protein
MIAQANVEYIQNVFTARLGDPYVYGGVWSATDPSQGCDCSGCVGTVLEALTKGAAGMNWNHDVSTESWPFDYNTNTPATAGTVGPYGTIAVANLADIPASAALTINIMHGGGGEDSHTNCVLQGQIMESNGDHGTCTNTTGGTPSTSSEWTDHWYLPGPIGAAVSLQGLDYAGGRPSGLALKTAGIAFVCRYLSDGAPQLPDKQLTLAEANDLRANNVDIVSNWESTGLTPEDGYSAGVADATAALAAHFAAGGPGYRPIYFSMDWDEAPSQDAAVDDYFRGVASVIGLQWTGAYGGYWPLSRLLNAGLITWAWQTTAWSGGNQDPRANILQDMTAGTFTVQGVDCDLDIALTQDYGQWSYQAPPPPPGGISMADAQSLANDANGVDGAGNRLPWRITHLLRDAQIGDLSTQTDGDA